MENIQLKEEIASWASTKIESAVFAPEDGYYPFEVIADAYQQGDKKAKDRLNNKMTERMKELVKGNIEILAKSLTDSMNHLQKRDYKPAKIFVYLSVDESKVIYTIDESTYLSDDFLDYAYDMAANLKAESFDKGLPLSLGFIADNKYLNIDALKADGYDMAIDLIKNTHIY